VRYFRRISFEHAALLGAGAFIAYLLSRYDVCFQDAEFLTAYMIDAGERVRVLDYVANIVALNTRLALWSVIFPHPSFTPMWVLTLGVNYYLSGEIPFLSRNVLARRAGYATVSAGAAFDRYVGDRFVPARLVVGVVRLVRVGHVGGSRSPGRAPAGERPMGVGMWLSGCRCRIHP